MAIKINADTTNGLVITPDTSGEIEFQQNGTKMIKFGADGLELPTWTTAQDHLVQHSWNYWI